MDQDIRNRYRPHRRDYALPQRPRPAPKPPVTDLSRPSPVPASAPPPAPAAHHAHHTARAAQPLQKRKKRRLVLAIFLILLLGGAAAGGYYYWSAKLTSPIPAATRASVGFPLIYPSKLPSGYHLDKSSFSTSGDVVLYTAVGPGSAKIAFTVQQRPPNFSFDNFYKQGLKNSSQFDTSLGQAAVGQADGRLIGSLATDKSWLLVGSTGGSLQAADLRLILDGAKVSSR